MRILLVRHGQPVGISTAPIAGRAIGAWIRGYDAVGITLDLAPPLQVCELAAAATCFVASDLRRARESAARLAGTRPVILDADLREAGLPDSLGTSLKLSPGVWIVVARLAWILNWCDASETIAAARARAARSADRLAALAAEGGCVVAVGHGIFNRLLARELRRRGWRGPRTLPRAYWGIAAFERLPARTPRG